LFHINFMLDFQELPYIQALHFWHDISKCSFI